MKIVLAGGGTAGHIEPALAVARKLQELNPHIDLLFLGTSHGLEKQLVPAAGFTLAFIPKVKIARKVSPSLLLVPFQLIAAIRRSVGALRGADCAIGFGGYVSAPLYLAAKLTRTPFVIHEQNARPGWANRLGAYLTSYRALSYPIKKGAISRGELTGLPLRSDVLSEAARASSDWNSARASAKAEICARYRFNPENPLVFVFGGSQGSQAINSVIESARQDLKEKKISVIHGVGRGNELPSSDESYQALPYIDEMAKLYLASDLVIARSGAVTCAEFAALGRFALFIPLPIGNGEQALNAAQLVASHRAVVISQGVFTRTWMKANITELLAESSKLQVEGDLTSLAAADNIAGMILRAAGKQ